MRGAEPDHHAVPGPGAAHQPVQAGDAGAARRVRLQTGRRAGADGPQQHQLHLLPEPRI